MTTGKWRRLFITAGLMLLAAPNAHALVITGFEEGSLSGWYQSPGAIAGIASGHSPFTEYGESSGAWSASEGSQFAWLMADAVSPASGRFSLVSQSIVAVDGQELSFDYFLDPGTELTTGRRAMGILTREGLGEENGEETVLFTHSVDDAVLGGVGQWSQVSHRFSGVGTYRLEFVLTGDYIGRPTSREPKLLLGIDDLFVTDAVPITPPIPEPGTITLLLAGLAAAGMGRRRR